MVAGLSLAPAPPGTAGGEKGSGEDLREAAFYLSCVL